MTKKVSFECLLHQKACGILIPSCRHPFDHFCFQVDLGFVEAEALVAAFQNFEMSTLDGEATLTKKEMVMSKVRKFFIFLLSGKFFVTKLRHRLALMIAHLGVSWKTFFFTLSNKTHKLLASFFFWKKKQQLNPGRKKSQLLGGVETHDDYGSPWSLLQISFTRWSDETNSHSHWGPRNPRWEGLLSIGSRDWYLGGLWTIRIWPHWNDCGAVIFYLKRACMIVII